MAFAFTLSFLARSLIPVQVFDLLVLVAVQRDLGYSCSGHGPLDLWQWPYCIQSQYKHQLTNRLYPNLKAAEESLKKRGKVAQSPTHQFSLSYKQDIISTAFKGIWQPRPLDDCVRIVYTMMKESDISSDVQRWRVCQG